MVIWTQAQAIMDFNDASDADSRSYELSTTLYRLQQLLQSSDEYKPSSLLLFMSIEACSNGVRRLFSNLCSRQWISKRRPVVALRRGTNGGPDSRSGSRKPVSHRTCSFHRRWIVRRKERTSYGTSTLTLLPTSHSPLRDTTHTHGLSWNST